MAFQQYKNEIRWKLHFASTIEDVFKALTTDEGRSKFWAEQTKEENGVIKFYILNYPTYKSKILNSVVPNFFQLEYFGTEVTFKLSATDDGGTDLKLRCKTPNNDVKQEMTAGWVSVLMAMKAWVDHGVDLRNHHPERVWEKGYADN